MPEIEYDGRTALVVVDVQNDFADPEGSLAVPGATEVISPIAHEISRADAAGAAIVYTQDWHPPDTPHFAKDGGIWPVHCVEHSWGARFVPALPVVESATLLRKGSDGSDGYSAFSVRDPRTGASASTELESILRARGSTRIVIVGLATDYCVLQTALDGRRLGLDVIVPRSAVRAVDREPRDGERALDRMRAAGAEVR